MVRDSVLDLPKGRDGDKGNTFSSEESLCRQRLQRGFQASEEGKTVCGIGEHVDAEREQI